MITTATKLGRYEIRSKIGEGGMGEVYLAQDTTLNRKVAIKFLPVDSMASEPANKRLLREAQAAAALDHPNICAVYEVGHENGRRFIVMQYVEGETLDLRIKRKPLELSESVSLAVQIGEALAEADAQGIIHRDIKPANIIITPRGQAKVMDFGLAKSRSTAGAIDNEAATQSFLTTPGTIIGTVPYMSPEQVHGQPLDARTDIFSFGVLLYEMLTGKQPFAAESPAGIISAILTKEPAPLSDYVSRCPQELRRIVSKCLEKDRERRYQTIRDAATDLENVSHDCAAVILQRPSNPEKSEAGSKVTVTDYAGPRAAFFTHRRSLVLGSLVLVAAVLLVYALLFKRPGTTPPATSSVVDSPAYNYYVRGRVRVSSVNRDENEAAIKLLEQAVAVDPRFAPAFAELARAYYLKAFNFASNVERKQLNEDAEVAVEKAFALNPDLAEAHLARGLILWSHAKRFPHEQAIQSYKRAIALNPNLDEAHHQLAVVYLHIGLLDKAWEEADKALAINPNNLLAKFRQGNVNLYRAKYDDALAIYKSLPPDAYPALQNRTRAAALLGLGRTKEAESVVEEFFKLYPADEGGLMTSVKAMLLAKAGKEREAEDAIQRAIEIGNGFGHFHHTAYNIASAYALLKKADDAMKWLQNASDDGLPCYPLFENDANLNNLRKDERFISFMAKLKEQWEHYQATL